MLLNLKEIIFNKVFLKELIHAGNCFYFNCSLVVHYTKVLGTDF